MFKKPAPGSIKAVFLCLAVFSIFSCENVWMKDLLNQRTVYFNSNGGSYVPSQNLIGEEKASRPGDPVRPQHIFLGWYTDNHSFLTPWDFNISPKEEMTLHAAWRPGIIDINNAEITVIAPAAGAVPNTAAIGEGNFTISAVSWQPSDSPFRKSTQYTASLTLTAYEGYKFADTFSALINGDNAGVTRESDTAVTLSYQFGKTEDRIAVEIEIISQPDNYEYTHGEPLDLTGLAVRILYDDDTFLDVSFGEPDWAANGITTSPAHGDALNRTDNNGLPVRVWLAGLDAAAVYTVNLIVDRAVITSADVSIAAPVTGAVPAVSASASGNVTPGEIEWSPNHTVFMGSETYKVEITIYANADYEFALTLNNADMKINGNPVNNVTRNNATSVTLSYQFGTTASKAVTRVNITTQPNLTYTHNDTLDLTGLTIKITYNDGSTDTAVFGSQDWAALTGITTNYNNGMTLSHTAHHNFNIWVTYSGQQANTNPLIVNPAPITNAAVTVTAPATNKNPDKAGDVILAAGSNFTVTDVSWHFGASQFTGNVFEPETIYTVTITLSANANYTFQSQFTGTVNTNTAIASGSGSTATLSYTFQVTAPVVHAQPPSITAQPQGGSYAQNAQVPLTVTAASQDGGTLSYRWYSNNANSSYGGTPVSGATTASYIPSTASIGTTYYYVVVTNTITDNEDGGIKSATVTSNVVEINVLASTVTVTNQNNNTNTSHTDLSAALVSILPNVAGTYIVTISANQSLASYTFNTDFSTSARDITLVSDDSVTIQLTGQGNLFNVQNTILRLGNGITLRGVENNNNKALVEVRYDGSLYMSGTAAITGNKTSGGNGGGVYNTGIFNMDNGSISGNSTNGGNGGGVYNSGTFNMDGGSISGNSAGNGGGVNNSGTFTMNGGTIENNTGHGVYLSGPFTMENGVISGNKAGSGGGVHLATVNATFVMKGGTISGNTASFEGGGVYITNNGTFTMSGGTITGNTANSYGGGVCVSQYGGTFTKTGLSVITGYSDDQTNGNVSKIIDTGVIRQYYGHAAYARAIENGRTSRRRDKTAGAGVDLDVDTAGTNGGWEN